MSCLIPIVQGVQPGSPPVRMCRHLPASQLQADASATAGLCTVREEVLHKPFLIYVKADSMARLKLASSVGTRAKMPCLLCDLEGTTSNGRSVLAGYTKAAPQHIRRVLDCVPWGSCHRW